jgi:putative glycerol-1-phosphate prenyltransferase
MPDLSNIHGKLSNGKKKFACLIDPDNYSPGGIEGIAKAAGEAGVDFVLYGGSLVLEDNHKQYISILKKYCRVPVILFPGNLLQINDEADGLLLLSLISGRNPEMLIGKHVIAAPFLKASHLEILPTGYMLIESGYPTTVSYMSNTLPIPAGKDDIAMCTAMAGEFLGLHLIYMDAGSGAENPVRLSMIKKVRQNISIPLIIGGGIRTPEQAREAAMAGADLIVAGNAIEKDPGLVVSMCNAVHSLNE